MGDIKNVNSLLSPYEELVATLGYYRRIYLQERFDDMEKAREIIDDYERAINYLENMKLEDMGYPR